MDDAKLRSILETKIVAALTRFPNLLDQRLYKGYERLVANSSSDFLTSRSANHLQRILLTQFNLQRRMEAAIQKDNGVQHQLFLKLFRSSSRICIALCFIDSSRFRRDQLLKTIQILLPGIQEIPNSFYLWFHPKHPYLFSYLEVHKLRGEELSYKDLKKLERTLQEQLQMTSPLTPALFWPYNEEESYRQVQNLLEEIHSPEDLPQISIHFQEQTPSSLEFLIHLARPKSSDPINRSLERLPDYLDFFCHFQSLSQTKFPIEFGAFALKIPSHAFDVRDSINLLYARRYVMKFLEAIFGPCRDFNGGLFEKQQQNFENLRVNLSEKIPLFDLFAEKVFYALRPVEKRLMLSLQDAEEIFTAFSDVMQGKTQKCYSEKVIIMKAANSSELPRLSYLNQQFKKDLAYAQVCFGGFYYHCVLDTSKGTPKTIVKNNSRSNEKTQVLRLIFDEGAPTSLNPHHSSGDMRCRLLCKLLFEGLVRLDAQGKPILAGAISYESNQEGTVYNFKLRPNRWTNGERVTAVDYATSVHRALREHLSHPEIHFMIKNARKYKKKQLEAKDVGIRALETDLLQIELEHPDPNFMRQLAQPYFFPLFGSMQEPKWFNGPYLVHEQNREVLLLKRNPYFWDTKSQFLEEIEVRWNSDINIIYKLFQEGKVDWIGDPISTLSPNHIEHLEKNGPILQQEASRQFVIHFNTENPVLSSPLIRRALSLAIDRSLLCEDVYYQSTPFIPLEPCREEANALFNMGLEELGLTRQTFPTLTFSYSHQARREMLALYLQEAWQNVLGIEIDLEKIDWNHFRSRLEKGLFEMCCTIQGKVECDMLGYLEKVEGESSWNFSEWKHPYYRSLIEKAKVETNEVIRKALLLDAEQILIHEAPFTPLFKYTHLFAHSPHFKGYLFDAEGCVDFSKAHY